MNTDLITIDPEIHGGTPVFRGTRVPIKTLFEHLEAGDPLQVFLDDFPSVSRELAVALLEHARVALMPMRILLDEDVPRRFGRLLAGHTVSTVPQSGWAGTKNGRLLALAALQFDVFLTMDQNIEHQQNLAALPIAVLSSTRQAIAWKI